MRPQPAVNPARTVKKFEKRVPGWVMPLTKAFVFSTDCLLAAASFLAAFKVRAGSDILASNAWAWSQEFLPYAGVMLFAAAATACLFLYQRLYRFEGAFSYTGEWTRVFKAVSVGSLLTVAWAFLFRGGFEYRDFSYSRSIFILYFLLSLGVLSVFHLGLRGIQVRIRRGGINLLPTLIIGTNPEAEQTVRELRDCRDLGYRVIAAVEGNGGDPPAVFEEKTCIPVVGHIDNLADLIQRLEIQEVIITDNSIPSERLFESMMQIGRGQRLEFRFAPGLFDLLPQKTSIEQIGVLPVVRLFREPLSDLQRFVKRVSDILISAAAIILLWPLWALVSILIRVDSEGPVLFRQERVGMDGRLFLCYKFRTMSVDADETVHREAYQRNIDGDSSANAGNDSEPLFGKVKDDPRVTRIGRSLRRLSVDELPQLFNVLKGDMSVVGPRPPIPYEVEEYKTWHRKRLDMKPGITGLWQVSGRNRLPFEKMVEADLYYIENWSIWLDLKIILLTLPAILRGDGAR
ncbi:MAG: sugar transferase [Chloracidobacterium sp.]|nr:sugar transferase [Chloracidobacterium sp.]